MDNDASMSAQVADKKRTLARTIRNDTRALFTGKRRPKLVKICPCCNKKFTTTEPRQIYKNDAHRKRFNRDRDRARTRTKLENGVIE